MELQELMNEREWRRCRGPADPTPDDLVDAFQYFCENYWFIKHPERGRIVFEMRESQLETIRAWVSNRYNVVLKARQIGFSTLAAAYAFWLAFFWPDRFIVMLSKTEREAAKLLSKAKYGYKYLPMWLKQRGPKLTSDNQLKMTFDTDSAIESLPSNNDPARGESVYLVIVDEMAFLPNPDEAWASIEPIADVGGRIICLSTANGAGNFFHQLWVGSQTGTNNFNGVFWPWSAGDRDDDWYESKTRNMPSWQLHQEYPRNADEAFIMSGNPVFDVLKLSKMATEEPVRGWLKYDTRKAAEFVESPNGELRIWDGPNDDGVYVIGADVAEGLGHGDFSSAHVIDARTLVVVAHWHGHIDPDVFGHLLSELGWLYGGCLVGVENNNHGLTTLKAMQRYGYKNIYRTRRLNQRVSSPTEQLGWRTTAASKPLAIDELAGSIRDDELVLLDRYTIEEMKTFVRHTNGKMSGSPHDDRVMSLAISVQMLKYVWLEEYRTEAPAPKFSLSWFEKYLVSDELVTKRVPIGTYNTTERR